MPNPRKIEAVDRIGEKLARAKGIYFTQYLGLDVGEVTELRRRFHQEGVEFEVVKNTLAMRSAEKAGFEGLEDVFKGPTAIAFSYDDPASPAKILVDFQKSHDRPQLKALIFEGEVMEKDVFSRIASLPSRDRMLSKIVGQLSAPMIQLALGLKGAMANLVNVLNQVKESKGS
ncbi:MAG: 50S ribosomal protein L10 [Fidelibacterota bacterium]